MPRGIKGSGKGRKPAGEPGPPRRRGRKPKKLPPEAVQPVESASAESLPVAPPTAEEPPTIEPATNDAPHAMPSLPAQAPELAAIEAELARKYPQQRIKRGSLLPSGATAEFGKKRSVVILCRDCGAERKVATSDLFQVSKCRGCTATAKRTAKKEVKRERTRQYSLTAAWRHPDEGSDYWYCTLTVAEAGVVKDAIGWLLDHAGAEYGQSLPRWTLKATEFQSEEPLVGLDAVLAVLIDAARYGQAEYGGKCPAFESHLQTRTKEAR
jgi:hypothetical protein